MQIFTPQGAVLEYAITQATKRDKRKRSTFNARPLPIPINITILYNSKPVKYYTYKSTISQSCSGKLPLSVKQVLGTSRNFYIESIDLLGATINLHTEMVARGTVSWMKQARPLSCSFSFDLFHCCK